MRAERINQDIENLLSLDAKNLGINLKVSPYKPKTLFWGTPILDIKIGEDMLSQRAIRIAADFFPLEKESKGRSIYGIKTFTDKIVFPNVEIRSEFIAFLVSKKLGTPQPE